MVRNSSGNTCKNNILTVSPFKVQTAPISNDTFNYFLFANNTHFTDVLNTFSRFYEDLKVFSMKTLVIFLFNLFIFLKDGH